MSRIDNRNHTLTKEFISKTMIQHAGLDVDNCNRDIIITPIKDNYGNVGSVVFSINGSPPRGHAILFGFDSLFSTILFIDWGYNKKVKKYNDCVLSADLFKEIKELSR